MENDLVIDDLDDDIEEPSSNKPGKIVLVRRTQVDRANEKHLIESIVKAMTTHKQ